jgi:carboxylesterase type B
MESIPCSASNSTCLDALSVDDIITAGSALYGNAYTVLADATQAEPIRPVRDGSLITSPMDLTQSFGTQSKPLLITNVLDEAGPSIYGNFPDQVPEPEFQPIVNATFGTPRTSVIVSSPHYAAPYTTAANISLLDARSQLNTLGTDYIWRCAAWSFAREWVAAGADAYVGLYVVGATYPGNNEVPFCTEAGSVCHQDDIEMVFGTVPSPTLAQAALTKEMQARYSTFMRTGNPNPSDSSYATWSAVSGTDVPALLLGGSGTASIGACQPSFWGVDPQYDYQVYDI